MSSVDVIVPCYRYGQFLRQCVESILAEGSLNVRVLIIDDASPDNTPEVAAELVKQDSRVNYFRHSTNLGHVATFNEGIDWASADYYLLISADDYLLPGTLRRAASLMDAHPEVGFTFGRAIELEDGAPGIPAADNVGDTGASRIFGGLGVSEPTTADANDQADWRILEGLEFIELSVAGNMVPALTSVVRTKLQKRLGAYRPQLSFSEDMEMWLRLAAHASVGIFNACQAVYRRHENNMTLVYARHYYLPAFKQRKAALDCFFETCSSNLPNAQRLRRRFFWSLSSQAVGHASRAFNEGELKTSEELCEFALRTCPEIKRSLAWMKLACKRRMGPDAWRALQPAVAVSRKAWFGTRIWAKVARMDFLQKRR